MNLLIRPRSEMDITPVFGTVVGGSNPSEGTDQNVLENNGILSYGQKTNIIFIFFQL